MVALAFVPGIERQGGVDLAGLPDRPMDAGGVILIVSMGAPIALIRRWPLATLLIVSGGAFCAYQLLAYPTTFAALGS